MSFESVKSYFASYGLEDRVHAVAHSSATVEEAAEAIGCQPKQIAKTMSFFVEDRPILIVVAGDARIDNKKYKVFFHKKAKMIPWDQVETVIGHAPGGVCPFAVAQGVEVYLDVSLKRFERVYPAGGDGNSFVSLSIPELQQYANAKAWVDVCDRWFINEESNIA